MTHGEAWRTYGEALLRRHVRSRLPHEAEAGQDAVEDGPPSFDPVLLQDCLFADVCARAQLTTAEAQALALLAAVELSAAEQRLVAALHGDSTRTRLSLGLLRELLPQGAAGVLSVSPSSALRRSGLVEVAEDGPWAGRAAWAHAALVWALSGDRPSGAAVQPGGRVDPLDGSPLHSGRLRLCSGGDPQSRALALGRLSGGSGQLRVIDEDRSELWEDVVRSAVLHAWSVCVEVDDRPSRALVGAVGGAPQVAWGLSSTRDLALSHLPPVPWEQVQPADLADGGPLPVPLPAGARLDREQLRLLALGSGPGGTESGGGLRRLAGGHLDRVTRRLRPRRSWEDLVLPEPLARQVHALVQRHRARDRVYGQWGFSDVPSTGTVALLTGPSGTGKTLTAEVVAGELGLDLYVLDLSAVVSKYIGETEKNLTALFRAAAAGDAVLFFDEADALFGKRSAVSDARDRYANTEVAHLLQELEQYDGLVLLASNLPANIDDAFSRRMHARLDFALPDPEQRLLLWRRAFPAGCPLRDVDLEAWARAVDLSGGAITNAALAAAFAAAAADEPVTDEVLHDAVVAEYVKQGRLAPGTPRSAVRAAS